MRSHRLVGWSVVSAVGLALTSCATLPTSGSVLQGTVQGADGRAQQGVQVVPVPPGRGWSPADIVNGFIAASAAFDKHNHAVARQYLTPRFNRTWHPGWAATIIDSPTVKSAATKITHPGRPTALVDVTAKRFSKLQAPGQDQAGSVVVSPGITKYLFSLVLQRAVGWRIDGILDSNLHSAPPTLLLLTSTDFARDYLPRNLYFYTPHGNALVPDPVYIPQTGPVTEVKGLVNALIHPPPGKSWLWHAATTAFPPGTKRIKAPQIIGGIKAVIDLGGAAARASPYQRERMAAQLNWSLVNSPYATQYASPIKSVVLKINNHPVKSTLDNARLVPHGRLSALYYQAYGAQEPTVAALPVGSSGPVPLPLPAGLGNSAFTTMAVSARQHVLAGCAGRSLELIKLPADLQEVKKLPAGATLTTVRKRLPAGCSSLSWDDSGNLWIAAQSQAFVLPTAGRTALAKVPLAAVQLPQLAAAHPPPISALRVAADGVRVAMIVGAGSGKRILLAAIYRAHSYTAIGATQILRVGSDIANPVALTWKDSDHLLALSKSGAGHGKLFEVPLNGGQSTEIPTPAAVTSVASIWLGGQTSKVVIGIGQTVTSTGQIEAGQIEIAKNGWPSPDWVTVTKGTSPVYPD